MSRTKRGLTIASILLLVALLLSACEQPYSTPPAVTNTPIDPNSLFTTPMPNEPSNMQDVENITTQTAAAAVMSPIPIGSATATIAVAGATASPTSIIALNPTSTLTQAVAAVATTAVPAVVTGSEWILRNGEFPYCIARRYNVDPIDLIKASGLTSPDIYYEGLKLVIPQNSVWNEATLGPRALRTDHSYTVTGNGDTTLYGVSCKYGVFNLQAVAQANNISVDANLTVGQTLTIP